MTRKLFGILILGVFMLSSLPGFCAISTTQNVTYEVTAINEIGVSGDPAALQINSATSGGAPVAVQNALTTYSITTNQAGATITGSINTNMPANTTLSITLAAPTGGTSAGSQPLSTVAATLATCVLAVSESGNVITYDFAATAAAGVVPSATKVVTLTVVP